MRYQNILLICFLVFNGLALTGQTDSVNTTKSKKANKDSITTYLDKRPRTAFFLGLALPGGGQAFNKRWWKIPLAYGLYGFAYYRIDATRKLYKTWDGHFDLAVSTGDKVQVAPGVWWDARPIKVYRDRFRDDKDRAVFLMIGVHFIVALEAFVDAHLKDFNIDDDLSFKLNSPNVPGPSFGLVYKLH